MSTVSSFIADPDPGKYHLSLEGSDIRVGEGSVEQIENYDKIAKIIIDKIKKEPTNQLVRSEAQYLIRSFQQYHLGDSAIVKLMQKGLGRNTP